MFETKSEDRTACQSIGSVNLINACILNTFPHLNIGVRLIARNQFMFDLVHLYDK